MFLRPIKLFFFVAAIGFATVVKGQSAAVPVDRTEQKWPEGNYLHKVDFVTVSQPGIVHHCRVHAISDDAITCGHGFARKPVVYKRGEVAALLAPRTHPRRDGVVLGVEVIGGSAGLAFAGPVAVVVFYSGCLGTLMLAGGMLHL